VCSSDLAAAGGGPASPLDKYLRTHPPDDQRIEDIRKWLPEAKSHVRR
jgi:Zn-dependent protease with chaperone function